MITAEQSSAQSIDASPGVHQVNAVGNAKDLTLSDPTIKSISFTLTGGAGGTTGRGGGGGSYLSPLAILSSITPGSTTKRPLNGNITYQVTLNQPPIAQCQDVKIFLDVAGMVTLAPDAIDNGSSDPDGTIENLSLSKTSFDCSNVGQNQVTLMVTDNDGSTDNCGIASVSVSPNSFTCANTSNPVTVTLTVTEASGNFSTCNALVTVEDNVDPMAICRNISVYLDDNGETSITANDVDGGSTDNCEIETKSIDISDFICDDVDNPVTVTLTVTDPSGNDDNCQATVTVLDTIPPDALCKNITIELDEQGEVSIVATDIDNGSSDACGIESYVASQTDFTCADLGSNLVVLTVTDVNGNSATCNAYVMVEDNLKPIVRTRNVTVVLDNEGEASVTPDMIDDGSTDNCTIVYMWLVGETEYDCGSTGVHEVVLKARDQSGNVGSYNAFVTVKFYVPDFKNKHGLANGDTAHIVDCLPWDISKYDLDYNTISKHGTITTHIYKEDLPEKAPWGMYAVWRYEYVVKDACAHTYKFNYYLALYDLAPPIYECFPHDTIVATSADVPPVYMKVKMIDVCQYVEWDTVMTMPVMNQESGDTLGYTRRWMARDPSGHESFKDQMIWLGSGNRNQYSIITGRIADEDQILHAKFAGEAGTNGLPVSLYRLDEDAGTRTWVSSWTTGDWQGAQGTYYFVPEHPGKYQVKIDTAICLVDTLKFNKKLWSDTLTVAEGESLDQGWVITHPCTGVEVVEPLAKENDTERNDYTIQGQQKNQTWNLYPNPSSGYLRLDINSDHQLSYGIYDALGRSVKTGMYQRGETIDIHGMNAGVYHLQLRDQKEILGTKKVLLME